jgi:plasmid stability protein
MPDLLVRNLPADLHDRLKAAAAEHRRSVTQETIELLKVGLNALPRTTDLPSLIIPRGEPVTMEQIVRWADDDLETRGHARES